MQDTDTTTEKDTYSITVRMTSKGDFYGDFTVRAPDIESLKERLNQVKGIFINEVMK